MISEKPFEDEKFIHPFGEIEVIEENYESEKKIKDLGIETKLKKATSKFVEKFKKKFKRTKELCLSETQKEAIKKLEKKFEMGHKRLLLDLEAGSGKTIVALEVAFNRMKSLIGDQNFFENQVFPFAMEKTPSSLQGAGILIVVNSTHLTNQFIGEIKKFYPDSFVGTEEDFIFQFQAKSTTSRMQDPLKLFKDNHESCLPFRAENISSSSSSFTMKKKQKKDVVSLFQIEEEQEENEQENEEVEEEIIEENGEVNSKKKHGFRYVIDWSKMNIRRVVQKKIEGFVLIVTSQRITNARKGSYLNWLYLRIPNLFSTIIYDEAQMFAKIGVGHWLFSSIIDSNPHAKVLALSGTFFRNDWYDIYGQASLLKLKKVYEGKIFEWAKRRFWVELGKKDKEESDSIWVEHFIKEFVVTNQINPQLFSELQKKFINRNISSSTNSSNISASEVESMDEKEEKKKEKNDDEEEEEKQERVLNHEVSQLRQFVPVKIDLISMDLDDRDGCSKNYYTFVSNWFEHLISLKRQRDQQMKQKSLFKKVITIPSVNHLILPFTSILQMTLLHPYCLIDKRKEDKLPQSIKTVMECISDYNARAKPEDKLPQISEKSPSSKTLTIVSHVIRDLEKNPVSEKGPIIIFSSFASFLSILAEFLEKNSQKKIRVGKFYGNSPQIKTEGLKKFHNLEIDVLLVTFKSGGIGLNLQKSCRMLITDLPYNFASFQQAIARVNRVGQKHDSISIKVFYVSNSIEDWKISLMGVKQNLQLAWLGSIPTKSETVEEFLIKAFNTVTDKQGRKRFSELTRKDKEKQEEERVNQRDITVITQMEKGELTKQEFVVSEKITQSPIFLTLLNKVIQNDSLKIPENQEIDQEDDEIVNKIKDELRLDPFLKEKKKSKKKNQEDHDNQKSSSRPIFSGTIQEISPLDSEKDTTPIKKGKEEKSEEKDSEDEPILKEKKINFDLMESVTMKKIKDIRFKPTMLKKRKQKEFEEEDEEEISESSESELSSESSSEISESSSQSEKEKPKKKIPGSGTLKTDENFYFSD